MSDNLAKKNPVYSVVAPVFNEIGCVEEFYNQVSQVMRSLKSTWELIMVDDGSTDGSTDIILKLAEKDNHVKPASSRATSATRLLLPQGWIMPAETRC